ncbi:hypothetical protein IQ269_22210 [Tychonema sp. LEGE 07199]|uniref:hypothetical protein n=1 Tax=unclassified Tychonema TaxID=2642144 RepID=UPI00187F4CCF|nr:MULTISPECIES: hypothetical protein [unclassified Tychonema]MBE9123437.1 hypothetical protein [Tychonema sp. LEGE 07199]MBE9131317.1 hypothetical protein [Tychonema sp. LEGE 07196]
MSSSQAAFWLRDGGEFVSDLNPTFDGEANQAIERAAFFFAGGLIEDGASCRSGQL